MAGWTPVNEENIKAADTSAWKPVQESKPEEKGTLRKAWDWINKPVADNLLPEGVTTQDLVRGAAFEKLFGEKYIPGVNDFDTKADQHFGKSPTKDAIKKFITGSAKDTSDLVAGQTSPVGLGTIAAGATTKLPGAIGTAAKATTGVLSAGFATQGATNVIGAQGNSPQAWQQRLTGGAQLAGGLAGAGATTKDLAYAPKVAAGLYESALKPSTTLPASARAARIQTGLENEIPVSAAGVDKLNALVGELRNQVKGKIASNPNATIDPNAVATRADQAKAKFSNQVNPESDLNAIDASKEEFLRNTPNPISATQAQSLKTGTYQQLKSKAYGELKSGTIEAQKALARGLKEELEAQFPEIKGLNAKEANLIGLDKSLERAVNRIGNWEQIGIGTPIAAGAGAAVTGSTPIGIAAGSMAAVLRNPILKSKLAIALARKGVPLNAANARVAAYANALANGAARGDQTSSPEDQQ